jgi:hypothetical protein
MTVRTYKLTGGGARGLTIGVLLLGVGFVIVGFGLVLLVALGVAAAAIGGGVMLVRRLMGRPPVPLPDSRAHGLDPRLEVFAERDGQESSVPPPLLPPPER